MIDFRKVSTALALGLAVAAATPALAAPRAYHPGYNARAQAIPGDMSGDVMSGNRAAALRECNAKAEPLKQYTWGDQQLEVYRSCMAEHGQVE